MAEFSDKRSSDSRPPLLVGVDGGATQAKACEVVRVADGHVAGEASAAFRLDGDASRVPVPIDDQRREFARGRIDPTPAERAWGAEWVAAYADAITSVAARAGRASVQVGVCAPGVKTSDARGLALVRHGPRIPDFLDQLESRLARSGLALAAPIPSLVGDGVACGLGEAAHPAGALRGVANAYYVGGGTGVAECVLVEGRVTSFDEVATRAKKAWECTASTGRTFEDELSMRGIAERYSAALHRPLAEGEHVEDAAARGDRLALEIVQRVAAVLCELVRARAEVFALERVVVGQRLGQWFARADLAECLRRPAERASPAPIVVSTLRAAPAIGAASRCVLSGAK